MDVEPIPLELLIHDVEYYEKLSGGRYDDSDFAVKVPIANVLVEYTNEVVKTSPDKEELIKAKMYIDCVHTFPALELKIGSRIMLGELEMFVQSVKPCYAFELHHYEIGLI
jgi:hypothetical protein